MSEDRDLALGMASDRRADVSGRRLLETLSMRWAWRSRSPERICGSTSRNRPPKDRQPRRGWTSSLTSVGAAGHPGEVPTPRTLSDRDGYLPALRFEVVPQRCRQRRGDVPREHLVVLFRGERDAVTVRLLPIHLQHVGTMGDVLEETANTTARLAASSGRRSARPRSESFADERSNAVWAGRPSPRGA